MGESYKHSKVDWSWYLTSTFSAIIFFCLPILLVETVAP